MLILNQLRYEEEIGSSEELKIPKSADISNKELEMAETLIDTMSDTFDISEYEDNYIEGLKKIIEAKRKHKTVKVSKPKERASIQAEDLVEQLKRILEEVKMAK